MNNKLNIGNNLSINKLEKTMNSQSENFPKVSLDLPPDEFIHSADEFPDDPDVAAYEYAKSPARKADNKEIDDSISRIKEKLKAKKNQQS